MDVIISLSDIESSCDISSRCHSGHESYIYLCGHARGCGMNCAMFGVFINDIEISFASRRYRQARVMWSAIISIHLYRHTGQSRDWVGLDAESDDCIRVSQTSHLCCDDIDNIMHPMDDYFRMMNHWHISGMITSCG